MPVPVILRVLSVPSYFTGKYGGAAGTIEELLPLLLQFGETKREPAFSKKSTATRASFLPAASGSFPQLFTTPYLACFKQLCQRRYVHTCIELSAIDGQIYFHPLTSGESTFHPSTRQQLFHKKCTKRQQTNTGSCVTLGPTHLLRMSPHIFHQQRGGVGGKGSRQCRIMYLHQYNTPEIAPHHTTPHPARTLGRISKRVFFGSEEERCGYLPKKIGQKNVTICCCVALPLS